MYVFIKIAYAFNTTYKGYFLGPPLAIESNRGLYSLASRLLVAKPDAFVTCYGHVSGAILGLRGGGC